MVDTYSPNLALTLQETGTNSGTWGTITNTNLGTLIEQAISGYVTQAITDGAATVITIPNGTTGVARNMTLELTGALTAARVLEVPSNKKLYFIYNNTTGGYAVTVKVSGQTGVSVPNGKKMILVSNGTDIVEAVNYAGTISGGSLTLTGNLSVGGTSGFTGVATFTAQPIMSSLTASQAVFTDGSKGLVSNAITGTGNVVMSNSPTLVTPALGTPASGVVTNLTGTASININGTVGATTPTTGAFTTLSASSSVTFSGGTANGVVYLNGSKVATSGSALTFDGTTFVASTSATNGAVQVVGPNTGTNNGSQFQIVNGASATSAIGNYSRVIGGAYNESLAFFNNGNDFVWYSGSERMRLTSTGLGIGTTSPAYKLDVNGTTNFSSTVTFSGGTANGVVYLNGSKVATSGSALTFDGAAFNANSTISSSAAQNTDGQIRIHNTTTRASGNIYGVRFADSSFETNASIYAEQSSSGNNAAALVFATSNGSGGIGISSATERMRIDSSGNLGLGVTPSTWGGGITALNIGGVSSHVSGAEALTLSCHAYYADGWKYPTTGTFAATNYYQHVGTHVWSVSGAPASHTAGNPITFTQAMTLDASGNLMLGATTASGALYIQNSTNAALRMGYGGANALNELAWDSGDFVISADRANAVASNLIFKNDGTERMRLDSSGNLRVGFSNTTQELAVRTADNAAGISYIQLGSVTYNRASIWCSGSALTDGYLAFGTESAGSIRERVRIDSSGNLLIGKTSTSITSVGAVIYSNGQQDAAINSSSSGTITLQVYSIPAAANRFYVDMAGTIHATSTSITAISDITLKENIRPLETGLAEVLKLQPRRFDWKNGDGTDVAGFIAQEVVDVLPDLVSDYKYNDTETKKAVKMGDMIPTLVKAIQEQQEIINDLRARVANLEKL